MDNLKYFCHIKIMSWGRVWAHRAKTTQPMHPNLVPKWSWDQIRKSQSPTNPKTYLKEGVISVLKVCGLFELWPLGLTYQSFESQNDHNSVKLSPTQSKVPLRFYLEVIWRSHGHFVYFAALNFYRPIIWMTKWP